MQLKDFDQLCKRIIAVSAFKEAGICPFNPRALRQLESEARVVIQKQLINMCFVLIVTTALDVNGCADTKIGLFETALKMSVLHSVNMVSVHYGVNNWPVMVTFPNTEEKLSIVVNIQSTRACGMCQLLVDLHMTKLY